MTVTSLCKVLVSTRTLISKWFQTLWKSIAFFLGKLKFIDSYQFMGASLQKLVTNPAAEGKDKFQNMIAHVQNSEQQDLLLRKGVYPSDYVDEPSKFAETTLPPPEDFHSQLQEEIICDRDYAHATPSESIMTSTWKQMCCYWRMFLKISETFVSPHMSSAGIDWRHRYVPDGGEWHPWRHFSHCT